MTELSSLLHTLLPLAEAIVAAKEKLDHIDDLDREIQDLLATEAEINSRIAEAQATIDRAAKAVEDTKALTASANQAIEDAKVQAAEIIESAKARAEKEARAIHAKASKELVVLDQANIKATERAYQLKAEIESLAAERDSIVSAIEALKAKLGV